MFAIYIFEKEYVPFGRLVLVCAAGDWTITSLCKSCGSELGPTDQYSQATNCVLVYRSRSTELYPQASQSLQIPLSYI